MKQRNTLLWLLRQVRGRWLSLILMTLLQGGIAYLSVRFALGNRAVIDSAVSGERQAFLLSAVRLGLLIAGIVIVRLILRHLRDNTEAQLDQDWKKSLFALILNGEYRAVSAYHSGELINRMNNDVRIVNDGLLSVLPNLVSTTTRLVAAVWVMAAMEPLFTLILVAGGMLVVLGTGLLRRMIKGLHKQVQAADGKVSSFLQENIENLLMVQAMDVTEETQRRADALLDESAEPVGMAPAYREILRGLDPGKILAVRRRNLQRLRARLSDLFADGTLRLMTDAPENSGLYLPVTVQNRDAVQRELIRRRFYCPAAIWPEPAEAAGVCPVSRGVTQHMLSLLCDQRCTEADMDLLADTLREIMRRNDL